MIRKLLIIVAGVVISILALKFLTSSTDEELENSEYQRLFNKKYSVFALNIPDELAFAEEEVPIDDYDIRQRFDRELLSNTYFQSNTLLLFKRANRWFPLIERILKEKNIPDDFKYLTLTESNLMHVVSPKGARGYWQLMESTAKDHGLEVNSEVDERYNVEKSTSVACLFLKRAHDIFGNWTLAAAAYNMGVEGVKKQLRKQRTSNYYDLLLNKETARYIFRILAIKEIISNPEKYGFHFRKKDLYPEVPVYTLTIDSGIGNLAEFALQQKVNYKILKIFNPWLRKNSLSNKEKKTYKIQLPQKGYKVYGILRDTTDNKDTLLFNKWMHSYEDDRGEIKVYRPATYKFPPARGRKGFAFHKDGEFIEYRIHPADKGVIPIIGKWQFVNDTIIQISFGKDSDIPTYRIQTISLKPDVFKLKVIRE